MTRYRAALFDLDGTLVDTLDDLADSMNTVLVEAGLPAHPPSAYRYFVGQGMRRLAEQAAPAATPAPVIDRLTDRMHQVYRQAWAVKSRPYPEIPELLDALRERDITLGVLSNKPDEFTQKVVAHFFPTGTFLAVMGARADVPRKPHPDGAFRLARELGQEPADIVYFGDTDTDMRTGRSAGMFTVGVTWGFRPIDELIGSGAEAVVDSPLQALDLL